jgi:hypothetical protein
METIVKWGKLQNLVQRGKKRLNCVEYENKPCFNLDNPRLFGDFWTSGTDAGCQGKYRWCSLDRDFYSPESMWADGEPQNTAQAPNCAVLVLNNNSLTTNGTLFSAPCSSQKRYICEVHIKCFF